MVNHFWIRTDQVSAGMGSGLMTQQQIGDRFEAPYLTEVFVVDHSNQVASECKENFDVDENCVNSMLEIGKPLGNFSLINNCQSFVARVIRTCLTREGRSRVRERALMGFEMDRHFERPASEQID